MNSDPYSSDVNAWHDKFDFEVIRYCTASSGALIHQSLVEARNALVSANLSVQIPRKRGLKELYNFVPTKKWVGMGDVCFRGL